MRRLSSFRKIIFASLGLIGASLVWAAPDAELTATVDVAIVNPTDSDQGLSLEFKGAKFSNTAKKFEIAVPELNASNSPGEDPVIVIQESQVEEVPQKLYVARWSISLYEFDLR